MHSLCAITLVTRVINEIASKQANFSLGFMWKILLNCKNYAKFLAYALLLADCYYLIKRDLMEKIGIGNGPSMYTYICNVSSLGDNSAV